MLAFLEEIVLEIQEEHESISDLIIVLPSKRAGGFFKHYLRKYLKEVTFSPTVISIEEFIEQLSGLSIISRDTLLIKSYEAYLATQEIKNKEDFSTFISWANALLNDFSEIDRYLIPPASFFSYLGSIKSLEKWGATEEETPLIKNYLAFWNNLLPLYESLTFHLAKDQEGYQGMVYRKAAEDIEHYIATHGHRHHYFIGFNALNTAEQHIIQALLETGNTQVLWDMDAHFYTDVSHSASHFLRSYLKDWKYYKHNPIPKFPENYTAQKDIKIVSAQNSIEEVKYVGDCLSKLSEEQQNRTAVVLANEDLLVPLLYSLPQNIEKVNVTMGLSLKQTPTASFFASLLKLHSKQSKTYYHKDIVALLSHPTCRYLLQDPQQIIAAITEKNISYITPQKLLSLGGENTVMELLFGNWQDATSLAIKNVSLLLNELLQQEEIQPIDQLCFLKLKEVFEKIETLHLTYSYLAKIATLEQLFSELLSGVTLDFEGDAYEGLQIMGVLETRVLDFENIIMLSVNEGVLPAGKSTASFITYDLKKQFGLPLYTDKDAIYTYHFYRLIQRVQSATFVYNSFMQGLTSGEKSRFLLQMEMESLPQHNLSLETIASAITFTKQEAEAIHKNPEILNVIQSIAQHYFSPSSLTLYIKNPMDFYRQKVLGINEQDTIEETVALNTLGTIVHNALEELYKPFVNQSLTIASLTEAKKRIPELVTHQFKQEFKEGNFEKGKNLIIFEVAKRYVSNIVALDTTELQKGRTIIIRHLESQLKTPISITGLDFPIFLGGKVDRIDEYDGTLRVIDYKTGAVQQRELEIVTWEEIIEDEGRSKAFQVLAYALVIQQELGIQNLEAGVISLKNMAGGFLKFAKREKPRGGIKNTTITPEILQSFRTQLEKLIGDLCSPSLPFTDILPKK